jgi:hypothetical protein
MYEEKSTEEIASQVGLSENATRQLIFRARAAFKKALIGDIDTTGMSAAAILSVAARKAASEGKKVGAAALTLIALVVMSITVFPGLNRATTDQMAEAPVNSGSSSEAGASSGSSESAGAQNSTDSEAATDAPVEAATPGTENSTEAGKAVAKVAPSPTPSAQAEKEEVKAVLNSPALAGIFNSDAQSMVLAFDQDYTAIGDNGLIARFTFNPTSGAVFTDVRIEVQVDNYFFDFKPVNTQVFSGKNADKHEVFVLVGDATYVYDEFGRTWSKSDLGQSRIKIEVVMADNGTTVKSIGLAMIGR